VYSIDMRLNWNPGLHSRPERKIVEEDSTGFELDLNFKSANLGRQSNGITRQGRCPIIRRFPFIIQLVAWDSPIIRSLRCIHGIHAATKSCPGD